MAVATDKVKIAQYVRRRKMKKLTSNGNDDGNGNGKGRIGLWIGVAILALALGIGALQSTTFVAAMSHLVQGQEQESPLVQQAAPPSQGVAQHQTTFKPKGHVNRQRFPASYPP